MTSNNIFGYSQFKIVSTKSDTTTNGSLPIGFLEYSDNRNQKILFDTAMNYNPSTETFSVTNLSGLIDKVKITDSNYNGNLKLTFSDGNNNLLDNSSLLYHPFFRILKVESNNSQTYQLLLQNSGQSAGIQIKGAPAVTQYEANITHYLDILKIQNTGTDTEIEQVGSGTIRLFNLNGSLTLNGSGNIVATGIFVGNGSLLTSLTTSNLNGLIQNNQLQNSSITIGNTIFNLGDTKTTITGLTSVTSDLFNGKMYIEGKSDSNNYSLLFSVIPLGVNNERLINTDVNIYWNPFTSTLTCYRLDGYATGLELQTFSNIKPFVFCDGGIVTTQSVYTTSSNDLCYDNNNKRLGIGNANPQSTLHILGLKATAPSIRGIHCGEDSTDGNQSIELVSDTGQYCYLDFTKINSDFKCRIMADVLNGTLGFHTGSTYNERISINSAGNVGIGTSVPNYKLDVVGGILSVNNSASTIQSHLRSDSLELGINQSADNVTYIDFHATPGVDNNFRIIRNPGVNGNVEFVNQGTGNVNFNLSGNIGIGTTSPNYKLQVLGTQFGTGNSTHFDVEIGDYDNTTYNKMVSLGTDQNGAFNSGGISIWQNGSTEAIRLSGGNNQPSYINSGNLGIGNNSPNYTLDITGTTHSQNNIYIAADDAVLSRFLSIEHATSTPSTARFIECLYNQTEIGSCTQNGTTAVLWNTTSDYRVKENVVDCDDGYNKILSLRPINFNYKGDDFKNTGFIAHELQKIIPEIVCGDFDDVEDYCVNCNRRCGDCNCKNCEISSRPKLQQLDYGKITPFLVHSIQVLKKENDDLKKEIDELKQNQTKIIKKLNNLIDPNMWFKNSI